MQVITIRNWLLSDASLLALRKLVILLLLLSCSYQLAGLTWQFFSATPNTLTPANPLSDAPLADNQPNNQRLSVINHAALFGVADKPDISAQTSAPRSRLNAQLTGIMASSIPSRSIAIIARNGQQQSYVIGDVIQGTDARISRILPDRVIITRQAQEEVLLLDDESPVTASTPVAATAPSSMAGVRQQVLKNPGRLMDYINISPVRENNQLKGYRLNPGRDPVFFSQSGLQPDDLAVSINGLDLRNPGDAAQALQQLPRQTEMNVTVERNGAEQDIYINLQQP